MNRAYHNNCVGFPLHLSLLFLFILRNDVTTICMHTLDCKIVHCSYNIASHHIILESARGWVELATLVYLQYMHTFVTTPFKDMALD